MKTEHIPRQVHFSRKIICAFVQLGASQQQSNISDWYFRGIQSSYIITNQSMKAEHIPRQVHLRSIVLLLCNLVNLSKLTFLIGIFVAPYHLTPYPTNL